jgi:tellurite resistance protein
MVLAALIWGVSLWQLTRRVPPAPLRPLLAIHLAPASLFASVAGLLGMTMLGHAMTILGLGILVALVLAGRWITESGFSPLWGAFTFPLAAYASAMLINGWVLPGVLLTVLALGANLSIAWRVIRMWPGGKLAGKTNAATA